MAVIIEDNPLFSPCFKGAILKTHGKAGMSSGVILYRLNRRKRRNREENMALVRFLSSPFLLLSLGTRSGLGL